VECRSRFTLLKKITRKTADLVENAVVKLLGPIKEAVLTITSDNGREFRNKSLILGKDFLLKTV
jgi:IS30 family transposase